MDMVTVTGTENLMMAAALAEGTTVLENAACEPEVVDLANCLIAMGAKIEGAGSNVITIQGVERTARRGISRDGRPHRDRHLSGGCGGDRRRVRATHAQPDTLDAVMSKLREAGAKVETGRTGSRLKSDGKLQSVDVRTAPHPAFPTDMQAQFMAMNTIAEGAASVTETIFENRFMHVQELRRLGANIEVAGNTALVRGVSRPGRRHRDGDRPARLRLPGAGRAGGARRDHHRAHLPPRSRLRTHRGKAHPTGRAHQAVR